MIGSTTTKPSISLAILTRVILFIWTSHHEPLYRLGKVNEKLSLRKRFLEMVITDLQWFVSALALCSSVKAAIMSGTVTKEHYFDEFLCKYLPQGHCLKLKTPFGTGPGATALDELGRTRLHDPRVLLWQFAERSKKQRETSCGGSPRLTSVARRLSVKRGPAGGTRLIAIRSTSSNENLILAAMRKAPSSAGSRGQRYAARLNVWSLMWALMLADARGGGSCGKRHQLLQFGGLLQGLPPIFGLRPAERIRRQRSK